MKTSEFARRVRKKLEGGWVQRKWTQPGFGRVAYCISGAMNAVAVEWQTYQKSYRMICDLGNIRTSLIERNDKPGRKYEDVIRLVDKVIAKAESYGD